MNYSIEEIKDHITQNYYHLNLTEKEMDKYIRFISKVHTYATTHYLSCWASTYEYFDQRFESFVQIFIERGYSEEESIDLTKKIIIFSDRKDLMDNINFIRILNCEKQAINTGIMFYRKKLEDSHARKSYLIEINDYENQTVNTLLNSTNGNFEKRFDVSIAKLRNKYPVTDELKSIWEYLANLTDEKLEEQFKLTKEELAMIYPTTKEELSTLKKIATLTDEEIKETYGITRSELLKKHPLNIDTLKALKSIQSAKNKAVENVFDKSKEEVLHLRTITTEMISKANTRFQLKKAYQEARLKTEKCMKKGTYPNG